MTENSGNTLVFNSDWKFGGYGGADYEYKTLTQYYFRISKSTLKMGSIMSQAVSM